jgi:alkanesulfonate monooxygenase
LAATASTTFDGPYHVALRFASLVYVNSGRTAWNIVTTSNPDAARNFGLGGYVEHGERYARAREFFDASKMHLLDHKGAELNVRDRSTSPVQSKAGL